jgi:hypothetical protein
MAGAVYTLFRNAILGEQQVVCRYDGRIRELCPHIIGTNKRGEEVVLAWQFGGSGPLPQWRCLKLDNVSDADLRERYRPRYQHSRAKAALRRRRAGWIDLPEPLRQNADFPGRTTLRDRETISTVIASEAKQSISPPQRKSGLLRFSLAMTWRGRGAY